MRAISHAFVVLSWQENLPKDEMPPEWMWALEDPLEEWFEEVEAARAEKYGGRDNSRDTTVPMMSNSLAAGRKRR